MSFLSLLSLMSFYQPILANNPRDMQTAHDTNMQTCDATYVGMISFPLRFMPRKLLWAIIASENIRSSTPSRNNPFCGHGAFMALTDANVVQENAV